VTRGILLAELWGFWDHSQHLLTVNEAVLSAEGVKPAAKPQEAQLARTNDASRSVNVRGLKLLMEAAICTRRLAQNEEDLALTASVTRTRRATRGPWCLTDDLTDQMRSSNTADPA
jgi:hypothetical protein